MTPKEAVILALLAAFVAAVLLRRARRVEIVHPWQGALLYRDGIWRRTLEPGRHVIFDPRRRVTVARMPTGEQQTRFGQMDVLSADRFAFRIHMTLFYTVTDLRAAYEAQQAAQAGPLADPIGHERTAAAALGEVGTRSLDEIVAAPQALAAAVAAALDGAVPHVAIVRAALTRIELPPETRRMLTEVERARRAGQAALERARGEQAALRALANAARLVRDNPELAQLRLLQTIEDSKGPTTIVIGDARAGHGGGPVQP